MGERLDFLYSAGELTADTVPVWLSGAALCPSSLLVFESNHKRETDPHFHEGFSRAFALDRGSVCCSISTSCVLFLDFSVLPLHCLFSSYWDTKLISSSTLGSTKSEECTSWLENLMSKLCSRKMNKKLTCLRKKSEASLSLAKEKT